MARKTNQYGLHVIKYPSGRWGFVGNVPAALAFVTEDDLKPTEKQLADAAAYGPRLAGVKTRSWASKTKAVAAAKALGYTPEKVKGHGMQKRISNRGTKPRWKKAKIPKAGRVWPVGSTTVWSTGIPGSHGRVRVIVGKSAVTDTWQIGGWFEGGGLNLARIPDNDFPTAAAAKAYVDDMLMTERVANREANREVGDIVLAAEQYFAAQEDEVELMKHGTPSELSAARKRTKKTKEALESITGANRELYGSIGGGTIGAALGALTGNVVLAAVGALLGSVGGSIVARPSLTPEPVARGGRGDGRGGELIQFPRGRRGYAANTGSKRR
jgi:hypothetical protein